MTPLPPRIRRTAVLALVVAAAFALRLVTLRELERGGLRLLSADDYGHLRRAAATVRDFPRVPVFDPYLSHPRGGRWIWPPLFDLAIAAPARLVWGAQAPLERIERLAAWLAPVLGALALWPLLALGRRALGRGAALGAAAIYAVSPAAIAWSAFGHSDQHVAEALLLLAALAALSAWLSQERDDWRALAPVALALAAAVLVWQGAVFVAPLLALAALLARRARPAAAAIAASALLVAPWAWLAGGPVTYISFGLFQPLFLGLCAALLLVASCGRWGLALAGAAAIAAAAFWAPIGGALGHLASATRGATSATSYLSYPKEWLALIGEYRPLLARGVRPVLAQLSGGFVLLPLAWALWLGEARREPARRGALLPLVCAAPLVLAMALAQRRYAYYLAPLVALALADLVRRIGARRPAAAAALAVAALLPVAPAILELRSAPGAPGQDLLLTLSGLAAIDPPGADPLRPRDVEPGEVPGVMAPWSIGHLVTLFARRPTVADNFGYGFAEQARFFTTPAGEDEEARRQLAALRCRYVLTTDLRPVLPAYAAAAGRAGMALEETLAARLQRSRAERPLPFLRLVLVSQSASVDERGEMVPRFKIYRVELEAPAGSPSG